MLVKPGAAQVAGRSEKMPDFSQRRFIESADSRGEMSEWYVDCLCAGGILYAHVERGCGHPARGVANLFH
jgi:hypothetical protein